MNDENPDTSLLAGIGLWEQRRFAEALPYFERVLAADPGNRQAISYLFPSLYNAGVIAGNQRRYAEAIAYLDRALVLVPGERNAIVALSVFHRQAGVELGGQKRYAEALPHFQRLRELDPTDAQALESLYGIHYNLGVIAENQQRFDEAITHLERALTCKPDDTNTALVLFIFYRNAGAELGRKRRVVEAQPYFKRALILKPDSIDITANLPLLMEENGQAEEAIRWYQRALAIMPTHTATLQRLGNLAGNRGQWKTAFEAFSRLLDSHPPDEARVEFHLRIAACESAGGTPEAADTNGLLVLQRRHCTRWESGSNLSCQQIFDVEPATGTYPYEVMDGDAHYVENRQFSTETPCRMITLNDATLIHMANYIAGKPNFHTDIVRYEGFGSMVTPWGIINRDFSTLFVNESNERIFIDIRQAEHVSHAGSGPVFHLDNWAHNYGHWMLDDMPRLLLMEESGLLPDSRVFSPWLKSYQLQTLHDIGFGSRQIALPNKDRSRDYVQIHYFDQLVTLSPPPLAERVAGIRRVFLPKASALGTTYERIFISRKNCSTLRILNEPEVASFLSENGFTVITPETLSLYDQIAIYANARIVMCATGSAYINLAFSQPGTLFIELIGRDLFKVMKDKFHHYDMFPLLGIRHIVAVFDNVDNLGYDHFPIDRNFMVDVQMLKQLLASL